MKAPVEEKDNRRTALNKSHNDETSIRLYECIRAQNYALMESESEELEDEHGNVFDRTTYEDLRRNNIL